MRSILITFRRCMKRLGKYKINFFFNCIEGVLLSLILMVEPFFMTKTIACIINTSKRNFFRYVVILIVLKGIYILINKHYLNTRTHICKNFNVYIKSEFIDKIVKCSPAYINSLESGKIINVFREDSMSICNYIYIMWGYILDGVCAIFCLIVLIRINIVLTLLIIGIYILNYVYNKYFAIYISKKYKEIYKMTDEYMGFVKNEFTNINESIVNNYSLKISQLFRDRIEPIKRESILVEQYQVNINIISEIINFVSNLVVIIGGGILVIYRKIGLEEFINYNTYAYKTAVKLKSLSLMNTTLQQNVVSVERYLDMLEHFEKVYYEDKMLIKMENIYENLELKKIEYKIDDNIILKNVNGKYQKGCLIGLIGSNGTGKTTLLNMIASLIRTTECNIYIDNIKINNIESKSLIKNITYVTQEPIMHETTVWNNLTLSDESGREKREFVEKLTKYFDLYDDIIRLENGFETVITEKLRLSTGQRKKIQIIRCLLRNTPIYLFDEPISNLDSKTVEKFYKLLQVIKKDKIIIMTTHSSDLSIFDKVIKLKKNNA